MAQQNGRELVIKRSATADGTGTKVFVCGMRTRSWTIGNAEVDTTVPNCDDPSLPIVATSTFGRQTLEFSGDGLADNDAAQLMVHDDARLQRIVPYEVVIPGYGTYVGPMGVYDFAFSADMEEPLGFSATWRPADASQLVYTPETP
jgi:predicted secreted protein